MQKMLLLESKHWPMQLEHHSQRDTVLLHHIWHLGKSILPPKSSRLQCARNWSKSYSALWTRHLVHLFPKTDISSGGSHIWSKSLGWAQNWLEWHLEWQSFSLGNTQNELKCVRWYLGFPTWHFRFTGNILYRFAMQNFKIMFHQALTSCFHW